MSSILSIATSGLVAAGQRLQVSAQNVAKVNSNGPLPSASAALQSQYPPAYTPQQVNQVAAPGGGTQAVVSNVQPSTVPVPDPLATYANTNGQVAAPNVDLATEILQQELAKIEYASNAQVARAYSQVSQTLQSVGT